MALYDEHRYRAMSTPTEVHPHLFWFVHGDRECVPVESCSIALRYTSYYTIQYHPMLYDIAVHRPSLLVTRHGVALGGPIVCCFVHSFIHSLIHPSIHPFIHPSVRSDIVTKVYSGVRHLFGTRKALWWEGWRITLAASGIDFAVVIR